MRLSSVEVRLSLVEILHREFKSLRKSLELSQQQVEMLLKTSHYGDSVKSLTENVTQFNIENKKIKRLLFICKPVA